MTSSLDRMQTVDNYNAVLQKFAEIRACAILRTATSDACPKAMQAAIDGGFKICEFTLTTPDCLDHLSDFRKKYEGDVMVGCGTILTIEDAENAVDAGSEFIATPVMLPEVIKWCAERNIVCISGCNTPTELYTAHRLGSPLQKLFPAVAGGSIWVKEVLAAMPFLRIFPTSGVNIRNAGQYLEMGAIGVGLAETIFDNEAIAKEEFNEITENATKAMVNIKSIGPYIHSLKNSTCGTN